MSVVAGLALRGDEDASAPAREVRGDPCDGGIRALVPASLTSLYGRAGV